LLFVLVLLILFESSSHSAASVLEGNVVKIADGDTITVLDSNKVQHRVRITGSTRPRKASHLGMLPRSDLASW
jgi:endonuclease YncB( thermonuclease family)